MKMLTMIKIEALPFCKNILQHNMLLKKNRIFQRVLYVSHCKKDALSVQQLKECNIEKNRQVEITNSEEKLPTLSQTHDTALPDPIQLIPAEIRHLQDSRILYSSLFPKHYNKPIFIKTDLRNKHVLLVKDKMKEMAVDAIVEKESKNSENSERVLPNLEPVVEFFPYQKCGSVLTSSQNESLKHIEKLKVNYEALPKLDRKNEISARLEEYDAKDTKPLIKFSQSNKRMMHIKYRAPVKDALQLQEHTNGKSHHGHQLENADKPMDTCLHTQASNQLSHKPDQSDCTDSLQVPSTNIKLEDVKLCSMCNILLDQPTPSIRSINFYTEEKNRGSSDEEENRLCQRCSFDVVHSSSAHVLVPPDSYLDVLKPMSTHYSLVLVVVDVMDAPCSIHPSIMDVIGRGQPVIVVANKVDLLPRDAKQTLRTMWHTLTEMLKSSCLASANIIDTVLVSAKTGFGITELRTLLQGQWRDNGDVFLVGGAGCGKTSLFKALADSIGADEQLGLAHRVKAYNWPLTNLGLLKFEMKRVHGELRSLERGDLVERTVRPFKHLPRPVAARPSIPARPDEDGSLPLFESRAAPLMLQDTTGEVGTSEVAVTASGATSPASGVSELQRQKRGACLYDTPSAVMPMQVLDLLTEEEVEFLRPRTVIKPQTFRLQASMSLFLAGLARIDVLYLHHPMPQAIGWIPHNNAKLTVYAAKCVPRTLVRTVDASSVYRDHMGDEVLMVPRGSEERLRQWPALAPQNFTATGPNEGVAAADIVLPSLGFVSVWLHPLTVCSLRVWTPGGRGAFLRSQSLLPYAIHLKGKKQRKALVYDDHEPFEEQQSNLDPSKPPSPERLDDVDPSSVYVKLREKLGYQPKHRFY